MQIFHPATNTLSRVSLFGAAFFALGLLYLMGAIDRSPYLTQVGVVREQPIPFSHKHHVNGLGIDCRYCHTTVEEGPVAGLPSSKTCMTCHSQVWTEAELLASLRESYRQDTSIPWVRVHDLPDFVYFDHSIHVKKGVSCQACHGDVDQMPLMWRENTLQMEWCLSCHRDPAPSLRPREEVFNPDWVAPAEAAELGAELVDRYHVESLLSCSVCHR